MAKSAEVGVTDSLNINEHSEQLNDDNNYNEIRKRHLLIVSEIENAEGHLATAIKNVYKDDNADKFQVLLDERIKTHDANIEKLCNFHYHGFIESILELLQVKQDVTDLRKEIENNDKLLQTSGRKLLQKQQEIINKRQIQRNIADAIEHISMCLPVLEMYKKLEGQMECQKYYAALKTLEQLEHSYLPRVRHYRFAESMIQAIPQIREKIKNRSRLDLNVFLTNLRRKTSKIGELAMIQISQMYEMDYSLIQQRNKKRKAPAPPETNPFEVEENSTDNNVEKDDNRNETSPQELVDYSPVYRCLHIYQVLRSRTDFDKYYREQREQQSRLALSPPANLIKFKKQALSDDFSTNQHFYENIEDGFCDYLHEVAGFFIIEEHIMNTIKSVDGRVFVDKLWKNGLIMLANNILDNVVPIQSSNCILKIKNMLVILCKTMQSYGFDVSSLDSSLLRLRELYANVLVADWRDKFIKILDDDDYREMEISDIVKYEELLKNFPYNAKTTETQNFPMYLPFSAMVPKAFLEVTNYIKACRSFTKGLQISDAEQDDMIRKDANAILSLFNKLIADVIDLPKYSIQEKLIRLSLNMDSLERSCVFLEEFISKESNLDINGIQQSSKFLGSAMFKDARAKTEVAIYKNIEKKIDEIFECSDYNWMPEESSGQSSQFIKDIFVFLKSMLNNLTELPQHVLEGACLSACKHIAKRLMMLLTDPSIVAINLIAIQNFELDILMCLAFVQEVSHDYAKDLGQDTLESIFLDLKELVELFINAEWSLYLAKFGEHGANYSRVDGRVALSLLEKIKEGEKRNKSNKVLSSLKRKSTDEKLKKKLTEHVIKELKSKLFNIKAE